ncbi:MAG: hypothetical protein J5642_05570 [Bacteroidales bacterium]|nr:hypothetical protein [Bacteroidales bacterium]
MKTKPSTNTLCGFGHTVPSPVCFTTSLLMEGGGGGPAMKALEWESKMIPPEQTVGQRRSFKMVFHISDFMLDKRDNHKQKTN